MSHKVGFWTVFAIVIASQVGSSVLIAPSAMAPYGILSLAGWIIGGMGAIALSLVFAKLCSWVPKTGGPHAYAQEAFGRAAAFFTGWTYWVVSWVSSTIVVITAIGYLNPIIGINNQMVSLALEIILICLVTVINFRGLGLTGKAELFMWILKAIPLLVVPIIGIVMFNYNNFVVSPESMSLGVSSVISKATLFALWGFIGLETATAAAGSVENPSKVIPKAVVFGTLAVVALYILNSLGVMGIVPGWKLAVSSAPYTDAAQYIFGGNWYLVISFISFIVLFGALNAWILTSGHVSLGLSEDKLMPKIFSKTNKYHAPVWGLVFSCLGIIALLLFTTSESMIEQVKKFINISVTGFLFVYVACCIAFLKLLLEKKHGLKKNILPLFYGLTALIFCFWMIYKTPVQELLIASLFPITGLPFYLRYRNKK